MERGCRILWKTCSRLSALHKLVSRAVPNSFKLNVNIWILISHLISVLCVVEIWVSCRLNGQSKGTDARRQLPIVGNQTRQSVGKNTHIHHGFCSVCLRAESLFFKLRGLKVNHILYILKPSSQQWSAACTVISLSLSLTTCWNCTLRH